MSGAFIVSIVYGVVPITAIIIGFLAMRNDYLPASEED